jgi:hypothetical protein
MWLLHDNAPAHFNLVEWESFGSYYSRHWAGRGAEDPMLQAHLTCDSTKTAIYANTADTSQQLWHCI